MLKLELLIILVGIIVFFLQNKIKSSATDTSKKIVYWTVMFFISLSFNTILFTTYGHWYNLTTYLNLNTFLIILLIAVGFFLIQLLSPFKYLKKFIKLFSINKEKIHNSLNTEEISSKETKYVRQLHFEIFLETICWLGFISIFALECYFNLFGDLTASSFIESNFILVLCLVIMITLPITLRQILFYLFNIRSLEERSLSSEEIYLQEKLRKNNIRL